MNQRCWRTVQVGHEHRRTEQLQYRISLSSGGQTDVSSICPPVLHTATSIQNKPRLLHSSSVFCRAGERSIHKASQNTHGEEKKDTYCAADGGRWRAAGPRLIPVRWPSSVTECVCVCSNQIAVYYITSNLINKWSKSARSGGKHWCDGGDREQLRSLRIRRRLPDVCVRVHVRERGGGTLNYFFMYVMRGERNVLFGQKPGLTIH